MFNGFLIMIMRFWVLLLEDATLGVNTSVKRKNENMMFGAGQLQVEKAKLFKGTFKNFWKAISECLDFCCRNDLSWRPISTTVNFSNYQTFPTTDSKISYYSFETIPTCNMIWANPVFRRLDHFCPQISNHSLFKSLC